MLSIPFARSILIGTLLAAGGSLLIPAAVPAIRFALSGTTLESVATYRLDRLRDAVYVPAIERALVDDDGDLATSLVALADERQIPLPSSLRTTVETAQIFDAGRSLREGWKGLRGDTVATPEALAGALAADLTGITDVRDLVAEGGAFIDGRIYDPLTLGLAAAGLTMTVATVISIGAASPARVGLTVLKSAHRTNALTPGMRRTLTALALDLVDRPALARAVTQARQGELTAARQSVRGAFRSAPLRTLRQAATDLGDVAATRGYRAAHDVLRVADTPADMRRLAQLSGRLGAGFRGAVVLLGGAILSTAGLIVSVLGWLAALMLWAVTVIAIILRLLRAVYRIFTRTRFARGRG